MSNVLRALWNDDHGFIITSELILISTLVVLGMVTGLACLQQAVVAELTDIGGAFRSLNQSYQYTGFRGCMKVWGPTSFTAGSGFFNRTLGCDGTEIVGLGGVASGGYGPAIVGPAPTVIAPVVPGALVTPAVPCPLPAVPVPSSGAFDPGAVGPCNNCPPAGSGVGPSGPVVPGYIVPAPSARPQSLPFSPAPQTLPQL